MKRISIFIYMRVIPLTTDFHSTAHFGDKSKMENVWCPARGKALKGANTFFAQDGASNALMYVNADIKREESSLKIKKFLTGA